MLTGSSYAGQGPIWLDDLACNGTETNITQCSHKPLGVNNCGHNEDVAIRCIAGKLLICHINWSRELLVCYLNSSGETIGL